MSLYKYRALSLKGKPHKGTVNAKNEIEAANIIKENWPIITNIVLVDENKESIWDKEIGVTKVSIANLSLMCSQFSSLLDAGISLNKAVGMVTKKTSDKKLVKMLEKVEKMILSGTSLADSFMLAQKDYFPATFIETIRAGEQSGNIENSFKKMNIYYEKQLKINNRIKQALTYPAFVLIVAIGVIAVLMIKVIPSFIKVFESYDAKLPLMTRILIGITNFFTKYYVVMILLVLMVIIGLNVASKYEKSHLFLSRLTLKLPFIGKIINLSATSLFASNMATLLNAGLPITNCIEITSHVIKSYFISFKVAKVSQDIKEGRSLANCLKTTECFPDILLDTISVGEDSGKLAENLTNIGIYYENELDVTVTKSLNTLEPAILVVVFAIAGFIVLSIYLAMFEVYNIM